MEISLREIKDWDRSYRVKFMNSISGYKAAHLIGTANKEGHENLAIFNSIVHIGANPPYLGFIMRPVTVERNTYNNIIENKYFTINHIHKDFLKKAHYTSIHFPAEVSEYEACNLEVERTTNFQAPFVKESNIKIGLKLVEDKEIEANGTRLIIGEVQVMKIEDDFVGLDGQLDLEKAQDVCVTGLNQYSMARKIQVYPYARMEDLPNFKQKERPDNVVYDKDNESYNPGLLPYGTNVGAPSIKPTQVSTWKNTSIISYNYSLNSKVKSLQKEYKKLLNEFQINEKLYKSKMNFEPIIGVEYHLYLNDRTGDEFLSLIEPGQWKKEYLGTYLLNHEKVWKKINKEN